MEKTQILMNKPVYFSIIQYLANIDLSKTVIFGFWYDYIKPKYGENVKLCYMGMGSYIFHVKTDYIYKDFAEDVEKRLDTLENWKKP